MTRPPAQRRSKLAEKVHEQIKADIFEFRLLPGTRFSENEIAARARVSRTPVREALFRLQRAGYVEVHAKSGWSVRPIDFAALDHLYDLRVLLECEAVRKVCAGDPRAALGALEAVWRVGPRQRLTDGGRVARLDEEFHGALVAAAGNPELARIHAGITERIRIVRRLDFTHPERIIYTYREHAQILRAILGRRTAHAIGFLKAHIESSKSEVRKISLHRLHLAHLDARETGKPAASP